MLQTLLNCSKIFLQFIEIKMTIKNMLDFQFFLSNILQSAFDISKTMIYINSINLMFQVCKFFRQ